MITKDTEFKEWCRDIRSRYYDKFNIEPTGAPNLVNLESDIQERMMRCAIEAKFFGIDEQDDLAILAHHTLLNDDLKYRQGVNDPRRLHGFALTDNGKLCRV